MPAGVISLSSHISVNRPPHHVQVRQGRRTPSAAISAARRVPVVHTGIAPWCPAGKEIGTATKNESFHLRASSENSYVQVIKISLLIIKKLTQNGCVKY